MIDLISNEKWIENKTNLRSYLLTPCRRLWTWMPLTSAKLRLSLGGWPFAMAELFKDQHSMHGMATIPMLTKCIKSLLKPFWKIARLPWDFMRNEILSNVHSLCPNKEMFSNNSTTFNSLRNKIQFRLSRMEIYVEFVASSEH